MDKFLKKKSPKYMKKRIDKRASAKIPRKNLRYFFLNVFPREEIIAG